MGGRKFGERVAVQLPRWRAVRETNRKRSVEWRQAITAIGRPELRVHDLRQLLRQCVWLVRGPEGLAEGAWACIGGHDNGPLRTPH
jgi:hypothetical protein